MMMLGELLCLGAYFFMKYIVHRQDPEGYDIASTPVSPLIMLPVTQRILKISKLVQDFLGLLP